MCGSDEYDPIDLDAFNADASVVGKQSVSSSFSSPLQAISAFLLPTSTVAPGPSTIQEIARYYPIFGYYLVTLLPLQVPSSNSRPAVPILTPMLRLTLDHGIETPPSALPFCLPLLPIQINSPTSTPIPSRAQTPADEQVTNFPPPAMLGMRGCGGNESRRGRGSHKQRGGRGGRNTRGGRGGRKGREVSEETAPATPTANNPPNNNNDPNLAASDLNSEDLEAERPKRRPRNRNMTP